MFSLPNFTLEPAEARMLNSFPQMNKWNELSQASMFDESKQVLIISFYL